METIKDKKELAALYAHCAEKYEQQGKVFNPMGFTPRMAEIKNNSIGETVVSFSNANYGVTYYWS